MAAVLTVTMLPLLRSADETVPPIDSPSPAPYTPSHVASAFGAVAPDASYVLNPAIGEYDRLPYDTVIPSADAKRLLIVDMDENGTARATNSYARCLKSTMHGKLSR